MVVQAAGMPPLSIAAFIIMLRAAQGQLAHHASRRPRKIATTNRMGRASRLFKLDVSIKSLNGV